jgi:hypothetical protein
VACSFRWLCLSALARLNEIGEREPAKASTLQRLRAEYEDQIRQVEGAEPEGANGRSSRRAFWPSTFRADLPDYLPLVPDHF